MPELKKRKGKLEDHVKTPRDWRQRARPVLMCKRRGNKRRMELSEKMGIRMDG